MVGTSYSIGLYFTILFYCFFSFSVCLFLMAILESCRSSLTHSCYLCRSHGNARSSNPLHLAGHQTHVSRMSSLKLSVHLSQNGGLRYLGNPKEIKWPHENPRTVLRPQNWQNDGTLPWGHQRGETDRQRKESQRNPKEWEAEVFLGGQDSGKTKITDVHCNSDLAMIRFWS